MFLSSLPRLHPQHGAADRPTPEDSAPLHLGRESRGELLRTPWGGGEGKQRGRKRKEERGEGGGRGGDRESLRAAQDSRIPENILTTPCFSADFEARVLTGLQHLLTKFLPVGFTCSCCQCSILVLVPSLSTDHTKC